MSQEPKPKVTGFHSKAHWKALGFRVPTKARPSKTEKYLVPGYSTVMRTRNLYSQEQVVPIDPEKAVQRSQAARKGVTTRIVNMVEAVETAELKITSGWTDQQIYESALNTHGGNYLGDPGEFIWSNKKARNTIRHCLTNYEALWRLVNRGPTAECAYSILRDRVDALVEETYPQFAVDAPEVKL
jgi:hypothetical protein